MSKELIIGISVCIGIFILILIFLIVFLTLKHNKNSKNPHKSSINLEKFKDDVYSSIGGIENYINHNLNRSRLTLELKDLTKIDKEKFKENGATKFLEMSSKIIIVGDNLENFNKVLNELKKR